MCQQNYQGPTHLSPHITDGGKEALVIHFLPDGLLVDLLSHGGIAAGVPQGVGGDVLGLHERQVVIHAFKTTSVK